VSGVRAQSSGLRAHSSGLTAQGSELRAQSSEQSKTTKRTKEQFPVENRMAHISIRTAIRADLPRITEIYNHYVMNSVVTFDIEPYTTERRAVWFEQFATRGRYRLLVAEEHGAILGYAGTTRFRPKAAYDTTVETTIYCAPAIANRGIGSALYAALFEALKEEDVNRFVAGYTLPNAASAALHAKFGFSPVGVFSEVGRKFGKYWDVQWLEKSR
jgi:phosphinothricin acetyltransferase